MPRQTAWGSSESWVISFFCVISYFLERKLLVLLARVLQRGSQRAWNKDFSIFKPFTEKFDFLLSLALPVYCSIGLTSFLVTESGMKEARGQWERHLHFRFLPAHKTHRCYRPLNILWSFEVLLLLCWESIPVWLTRHRCRMCLKSRKSANYKWKFAVGQTKKGKYIFPFCLVIGRLDPTPQCRPLAITITWRLRKVIIVSKNLRLQHKDRLISRH